MTVKCHKMVNGTAAVWRLCVFSCDRC